MSLSLSILLFLFLSLCSATNLTCYEIIVKLSSQDKCLSSRSDFKVSIASHYSNPTNYGKAVRAASYKCNGTFYSCGLTRSWVTEVFEGVEAQFSEYKYYDGFNGVLAGYVTDYEAILTIAKNLPYHVMFHIRHTGAHDHVWTVEQLANKGGYRIYQSYKDTYSLKAWLSQNLTGLFEADNGDIMLPRATQAMIDAKIQNLTGGAFSLKNLSGLPDQFKPMLPYLEYIRDFNQTFVMNRFQKAWELYGQGKILNNTFFWNDYVKKLSNIVNYLKKYDNTENPFPQDIYDTWIELFGAADNTVFPGFPTNLLTKLVTPGQVYRFEILSRFLFNSNSNDQLCLENAKLLVGEKFDWNS